MSASKLSTVQFIERAKATHGNKYLYPNAYTGSRDFISVICPSHGPFNVRAYSHLAGSGCRRCDIERHAAANTLTHDQFVARATSKHADTYSYPEPYVHSNKPLTIVCSHHGPFKQLPYVHLLGNGCRLCANEQITGGYTEHWFKQNPQRYHLRGGLYILDVTHPESFFKVGFTNNLKQRLTHYPKIMEYGVLSFWEMLLYDAFTIEQQILTANEGYKYYPSFAFTGHTECLVKSFHVKQILEDMAPTRLILEAN